jgi:hypothetical protein
MVLLSMIRAATVWAKAFKLTTFNLVIPITV